MDFPKYFQPDPRVCGGEIVITGTRVILRTVLARLAKGSSFDEILKDYPSLSDISSARLSCSRLRPQRRTFRCCRCQLSSETQTRREHFGERSFRSLSQHSSGSKLNSKKIGKNCRKSFKNQNTLGSKSRWGH
ncbi:MAG: DUF433 domain-containing protein [Verrucomicrobia bacterium]|nr:DUF433 domain-containing protein [Verrucomicrobiota bacterium]